MSATQDRPGVNRFLLSAAAMTLIYGGVSFALSGDTDPPASAKSGSVAIQPVSAALEIPAPEKVIGAESCKECHKSEHAAWATTMHSRNFERIGSSSGEKIAQAYGSTDACHQCHSTPHTDAAKFAGQVGVSCESCHTPAGGADGWFKVHSDYGAEGLKREDETADHLKARLAQCDAAGMIRASNVSALARNCYSCHIVADEKLLAAGHKTGQSDFDLIPWMQGEVRHNFQVDQSVNAESPSLLKARYGTTAQQRKRQLLVIGKMVELETLLRNLGSIAPENLKEGYAGRRGWAGRAEDVFEYLDEEIGEAIDNDQVKAAVTAVKDIELGRKFEDQEAAKAAAGKLAAIAEAFEASSGAADLSGLDELIEDLDKPKGQAFSP